MAAVTGAREPVSFGALERAILRTVQSALPAVDTFTVIVALQWHSTFMRQGAVQPNLLADGGFIFSYGLGERGLSGI